VKLAKKTGVSRNLPLWPETVSALKGLSTGGLQFKVVLHLWGKPKNLTQKPSGYVFRRCGLQTATNRIGIPKMTTCNPVIHVSSA